MAFSQPRDLRKVPPTQMEWRRDGYIIFVDAEGVHIKTTSRSLEMPEAMAMVELYQAIVAKFQEGSPFGKPTHIDIPF